MRRQFALLTTTELTYTSAQTITGFSGSGPNISASFVSVFGDFTGVGAVSFLGGYSAEPQSQVIYTGGSGGTPTNLYVSLNNGAGSYPSASTAITVPSRSDSKACQYIRGYTGDFNGDGQTDIYWDCYKNNGNYVQLGYGIIALSNGDGTFSYSDANFLSSSDFTTMFNASNGAGYNVLVADLNGDGASDIVLYNSDLNWRTPLPSGQWTYLAEISNHSGASFTAKYASWTGVPQSTSQNYSVQIADFNGDGNSDFLLSQIKPCGGSLYPNYNGSYYWVIGNGDGTVSAFAVNYPDSIAVQSFTSGGSTDYLYWAPTVGQFGNDGNSGILWQEFEYDTTFDGCYPQASNTTSSTVKVWVGKGDGNFISTALAYDYEQGGTLYVGDFRGIGRSDVLFGYTNDDPVLFLNNGDGSFSDVGVFSGSNPTSKGGTKLLGGIPTLLNITGHGKVDILWGLDQNGVYEGTSNKVWTSDSTAADLLSSVTSGLGHITSISYGNLINGNNYTPYTNASYPIIDFSGAVSVVTSVVDDQGLGTGGTVSANYTYAGAKFDLSGRGFLSFSQRTITDIQGNVTTNNYHTLWPETGLLSSSATVANGQTVSATQNTYSKISLITGELPNGALSDGNRTAPGYATVTLHQSVVNTADLDNTAGASTTTSYSYDSYNNPVTVTSTITDLSAAPWSSAVTKSSTTNIYTNDPSTWIMGQLVCSQMTSSVTGGSYHTRTVLNAYNGYGLLTKTVVEPNSADEMAVAALDTLDTASGGGNSASVSTTCQTTATGDNYRRLETDYARNSYGNLTSVTERPSDTLPNGAADPARRISYPSYDANNRLPATVTNALGQATDYTYDWRFGSPHIVTSDDDKKLTSTTTYDGFGRPTQVTAADGTYVTYTPNYTSCTTTGSVTCAANGAFQWTVRTYGTNNTEYAPWQQTTYDTLGRVVAQDSPTFSGQSWTSDRNRVTTSYNPLLQTQSVSQPYFTDVGPSASTSYKYDALNRVTSVSTPGCGRPATYSYTDGGLLVTATNCDLEVTQAWSSGSGAKIQSQDALGNVTTMQPGPFGKTLSVTDPAGNSTQYTYDNVGNLTTLFDPDSDTWISTFDSFGETLTKIHNAASSQETYYSYDKLGRPTQRQDLGSGATDNWSYGATNSASLPCDSQLASESTSGGYSVTYSYDSLCRETTRNFGPTEINNAAGSSGSTFQTVYDLTTGRMNTITYPSGVVASFGYSAGNYPSESLVASAGGSAHLFSKILTANAALQPMTGTTGDGVGTVWSWDGNNRLSDITAGPSGSATSVQNLGYLYDGLGNVTYRRDSIAGFAESFTYDAKNQLTAAYLNSDTTGKAFAYDALGNLTYRSDIGLFTYGYSGKPHTLASIQVDPNSPYAATAGTLESNNYSWTWFNKVSEVTQSGGDTLQYEYDNRHRRYTQTDVSTTAVTTYLYGPGGTEEDQSGRPHVGGVALHDLIPGPGGIVGEVLSGGTGTITSTYYYHKDQLGSVTAVSGSSSEVDSYDVWGKRRLTTGGDDTNCSTTSIASRGYIAEEHIQGDCPVINLNARLYDPLTTRFLSPDPMGLAAGPNPYAYAGNNPISSKDPTGLIQTVTVQGAPPPETLMPGDIIIGTNNGGIYFAAPGTAYTVGGKTYVLARRLVAGIGSSSTSGGQGVLTATVSSTVLAALNGGSDPGSGGAGDLGAGGSSSAGASSAGENTGWWAKFGEPPPECGPGSECRREAGLHLILTVLGFLTDDPALAEQSVVMYADTRATSLATDAASEAIPEVVVNATGGGSAGQLAINRAAGAAFEQSVGADLAQSDLSVGQQLTVKTQSGVRTRLDFLTQDPMTGEIGCIECKASPTAPLTDNQAAAFPEIGQTGGTILGAGKPGFPGGMQLPPTTVQIIRGQ
jgi:RHS repeat-associated protein